MTNSQKAPNRVDSNRDSLQYATAKDAQRRGGSPIIFVLGLLALLVSIAASLMLCLEHVWGLSLPGCGPGSPCATLARSVWGKVPLGSSFGWPVSFLGLAYFCAMA